MHDIIEIGRRQRKRQALHATLLLTAEQLFRERGINGTTVDDIAEAADVARQTVFNHFPYKEAIALELAAEIVQTAAERSHALLEVGLPALEVLERAAHWVLDSAVREPEVAMAVARELLHTDSERAERAAEHVPLGKLFEAILEQAREEGGIREDLPLDVVSTRICNIITSLVTQVTTCEPSALRRNLDICFDMLFNGITQRSA
jgi:AcrR family transcriptional regulator